MMWWRRKRPETEMTSETYLRWLRAQRPPFDWFARQPELVQQHLADLGDLWLEECVAASRPQETEEDAARRIAAGVASSFAPGPSMGGLSSRRAAKVASARENGRKPTFMGEAPTS